MSPGGLPPDVIASASHRLAALAKVVVAGSLVYIGLEVWDGVLGSVELLRLLTAGAIFLFSVPLILFLRRVLLDANQVYWVGLFYLLDMAFLISLTRHSVLGVEAHGWSSAAVLALLFPALVPCSPRRAAFASSLVLGTSVAALAMTLIAGMPFAGVTGTLRILVGEIVCIPVSAFVSSIVYNLGRQLESALRLGAYTLEERLGQGGMGEVWRGRHSMLARPAAIKLIRCDALQAASGEAKAALVLRFEREAQATATLQCPHTVEVFDFGLAADGTFYYVMELLDGIDLHALVVRYGPLPPERVVALLRQACLSLSEAHGQGLVHRDIKPANLVVCRLGEEVDFLKVLDFGLVTTARGERDSLLSSVGQVTGTPAFISPEQGRGDAEIDGRSDLYALGCVGYWLLSGQLVFEGSSSDIVAAHIGEEPRPVSLATLEPVPEELERIVLWCLAKDPARRPQTARELMRALDTVGLSGRWTEDRAQAWWLEHERRAPGTRV